MLTVAKHTLSERDIFLLLSYSKNTCEEPNLSEKEESVLLSVVEKAGWNIDSVLKETIHGLEDEWLRNWFRRFLISKKYWILPRYPKGGTQQYAIVHLTDECVLVHCPSRHNNVIDGDDYVPTSTIVLSPTGEIVVPENVVWLNGNDWTLHGFTAKWGGKFGLYTERGKVLLPCIFEELENNLLMSSGNLLYKGINYTYTFCGITSEVNPAMFRDDKTICFSCEDKVYSIAPLGDNYNQESLDELSGILYSLHEKTA